ncbi:MAG TPA: cation diffusion facilitator family transporter [Nakamurella sp.]
MPDDARDHDDDPGQGPDPDAGQRRSPEHGHHQEQGRSDGHGHSHGPVRRDPATGAAPASAGFRGRLTAAFCLTAGMFVAELVVGLLASSLAVVADAGHLATDVVTLGAALVATRIAVLPDSTGRRTYGRYRAEVFASGLAVLLMLGVGVFVVVGAISRIGETPDVAAGLMAMIGAVGLVVNLICVVLLRGGAAVSLTVKGAYLEVLGDAAGSIGVLLAGVLIAITGSPVWDVVVAVAIGAFVVVRAVGLGRSVLHVLGQRVPVGLDPAAVARDLAAIDGVADVHDLHLWELTSGMPVATAHLVSRNDADAHAVLDEARDLLSNHYRIEHATLQVEPPDHTSCRNLGW